ncbi:hypothetical protein ABW19_dt0205563 [Dactylella cylindrospora]|nr:hypothetical protein ABW19_dt0205563 [Dactylella cylindrospora]
MAPKVDRRGSDVTPPPSSTSNTIYKLPYTPPYDVYITVVSASHVPVGDIHGKSDVYIIGKLKNVKGLVPNEPESSRIHFRTSTCRSTRDPEWNEKWKFGSLREGTYLKLKLFDEDPRKKLDDKLGSVKFTFSNLQPFLDGREHIRRIPIRGHKGKKHIQLLTAVFDICNPDAYIESPQPHIQLMEPLNPKYTKIYLQKPTRYSVHSSPLANLVATTPSRRQWKFRTSTKTTKELGKKANEKSKKGEETSFKAYKISLIHPPPDAGLQFRADESHAKAFDASRIHYRMFRRLVRKQYRNIYGHDSKTTYGGWWNPQDVGLGLVELLEPIDDKLFTFVITTDGEWRFCETGDEYKINHLSKHGMHSDASRKVAWSGEFFIRRERNRELEREVGKWVDPEMLDKWTIYLDNDSGTYSPDKEKLGEFWRFMTKNLRGLDVVVKDFKDEGLKKAKKEQKGEEENHDTEKREERQEENREMTLLEWYKEEVQRRKKAEEEEAQRRKKAEIEEEKKRKSELEKPASVKPSKSQSRKQPLVQDDIPEEDLDCFS